MKKFICIITAVLLLFSSFSFSVFAESEKVTFSDDFKTAYYNGYEYSRFNTGYIDYDYYSESHDCYEPVNLPYELTKKQKDKVKEVSIDTDKNKIIFVIYVTYKDGSSLSVEFLRNDYIKVYNEMINTDSAEYVIDFIDPEDNIVTATKDALLGETYIFSADDSENYDYNFEVLSVCDDGKLKIIKGDLYVIDDEYYYVDYAELGIEDISDTYDMELVDIKTAHKITDEALIKKLDEAYDKYFADTPFDVYDDLGDGFSSGFVVFLFGIVPLVVFIAAIVLALRTTAFYKKLFRILYIISGMELVVFTVIVVLINVLK